jgi:HAD superfamily hydrolase (TIGR01549 family)
MTLKAIFYDLDGTLVYFKIDYKEYRSKIIELLENNGIPKGKYGIERPARETIISAKIYMADELHYSDQIMKNIMAKLNETIIETERIAAEQATPVKNVDKLLNYGKEKGLLQIICTYNTHAMAKLTLERAGIAQFIDEIVARDDVSNPKPDPSHIETAAKKFNLKKEECFMIGDHFNDIDMARGWGCKSIGVKSEHELNSVANADYIVNQATMFEEIVHIIKQQLGKS